MMPPDLAAALARVHTPSEDVVFQIVHGEAILLHLSDGTYFGLNEVGTLIWRRSLDGASLAEIAAELVREYDVAPEQVARDLVALTKELEAARLVKAAPG